jgi:hypothetical protein
MFFDSLFLRELLLSCSILWSPPSNFAGAHGCSCLLPYHMVFKKTNNIKFYMIFHYVPYLFGGCHVVTASTSHRQASYWTLEISFSCPTNLQSTVDMAWRPEIMRIQPPLDMAFWRSLNQCQWGESSPFWGHLVWKWGTPPNGRLKGELRINGEWGFFWHWKMEWSDIFRVQKRDGNLTRDHAWYFHDLSCTFPLSTAVSGRST